LEAGRIICVQQRFLSQLIKQTTRATFAPEQMKTADNATCELSNSDGGVKGLETSELEENKEVLSRVKRQRTRPDTAEDTTNEGHIISCGSEPEITAESGEESSDEDEATFLRKLEAKAMEKYVNSIPTEVAQISRNSDTDVTDENTRRNKKRKMCANGIVKDVNYEGSNKKGEKAALQNEAVKEPKGIDCGQAMRLSLTAGFVWDADPSLLPAAAAPHKSDSSSDEEEVAKVYRHYIEYSHNLHHYCLTVILLCKCLLWNTEFEHKSGGNLTLEILEVGPNEAAPYIRKHRNFTLPVMFFYSDFTGMDFKHCLIVVCTCILFCFWTCIFYIFNKIA